MKIHLQTAGYADGDRGIYRQQILNKISLLGLLVSSAMVWRTCSSFRRCWCLVLPSRFPVLGTHRRFHNGIGTSSYINARCAPGKSSSIFPAGIERALTSPEGVSLPLLNGCRLAPARQEQYFYLFSIEGEYGGNPIRVRQGFVTFPGTATSIAASMPSGIRSCRGLHPQ